MREKMERFSLLPFSIGCVSHSSVDVVSTTPKKASAECNILPPMGEDGDEKMKSSIIGERLIKIVKDFKSLPQVFQLYREEEDDGEVEMEIGVPTDVQHVAHIGWEGSSNIPNSWNRTADQLLSFPSLSMRQIDIAMAKKAAVVCL